MKCGLDPSKLGMYECTGNFCIMNALIHIPVGRIIRYLVIHHVYRELKPDVFANNRISATLDTGKNAKDNFAEYV